MNNKRHHLSSIPENNETEEERAPHGKKFVSKNKHDVLKAKYKCLKKLFQVYDASIIGILPPADNHYEQGDHYSMPEEPRKHSRRRKSYRSKIDASACTNEESSGDITLYDKDSSVASSAVMTIKRSCSTQMVTEITDNKSETEGQPSSHPSITIMDHPDGNCNYPSSYMVPNLPNLMQNTVLPQLMMDAPRKLTRFQSFIQRLFGIRREKAYINPLTGHIYAASDNNIAHLYGEKRRRTGLRFRRLKKPKKVHSEIQLRDCPAIMQYVQSVQRHCLLDRTPRQCPITGCTNMFYGIINYNDHLNLCHFTERKYVCHYCHEGFGVEFDKYVHENEHLGITKLSNNPPSLPATFAVQTHMKKTSVTQTDPGMSSCDVPDDKLKKIVSFFDKIVDTEHILSEMKNNKNRFSETNLQSSKIETNTASETTSDKRTLSCVNLLNRKIKSQDLTESVDSEVFSKCPCSIGPSKCHFCGEEFDNRRQLNMHVEFEHGIRDKFRKLHSCAGITDCNRIKGRNNMVKLQTGKIDIRSNHQVVKNASIISADTRSEVSRNKSEDSLSYDPSTNIIYSESMDSMKKSMIPNKRSGITTYRWEPGTKIIRI